MPDPTGRTVSASQVAALETDRLLYLANEIERLSRERSCGRWKADIKANLGDNWLIAFLGCSPDGHSDHIVTTFRVRASEATSRPEIDAQIIPLLVNNARRIVDALRFQAAASETAP